MHNTFYKVFAGVAAALVLITGVPLSLTAPSTAQAANASFNTDPQDFNLLYVSNYTRNPNCSTCWSSSISGVQSGEVISFIFYIHNTGSADATNTRVRLDLSNGSVVSGAGTVSADNAASLSRTVSASFASGVQTPVQLTYVGGEYYANASLDRTPDPVPGGQSLSNVGNGGINIGTVRRENQGSYTQDVQVVVRYRVTAGTTGQCVANPSLRVTPSSATTQVGSSATYRAFYDPDGTGANCTQAEYEVTNSSSWTSSNSSIAPSNGNGTFSGNAPGNVTVTATYQGRSDNATLTVTGGSCDLNPQPTLRVSPAFATVNVGNSTTYRAYYDPDGNCPQAEYEVTGNTSWSADSTFIGAHLGSGTFRGVNTGSTPIRATYAGLTGTATLQVGGSNGGSATLVITPSRRTIDVDDRTSYRALYDPDGPSGSQGEQDVTDIADWSIESSSIASNNDNGDFRGRREGSTDVRVDYRGLRAEATLRVNDDDDDDDDNGCNGNATLVIVPPAVSVGVGQSYQYRALYDADGPGCSGGEQDVTGLISWSSANAGIATNVGNGTFRGVTPGSSTIFGNYRGLTATGLMTVQGGQTGGPVIIQQPPVIIRGGGTIVQEPISVTQTGSVAGAGVGCLTVTPSVDVTELLPNQEFVYTTMYRNDCPFALNNAVLRIYLPNEVDFLASSNPFFLREGQKFSYTLVSLPVGAQGSVAIRGFVRRDARLGDTLIFNSTLEFVDFNNQVQSATSYLSAVLGGNIERTLTASISDALRDWFGSGWFWLLLILILIILAILLVLWYFLMHRRKATASAVVVNRNDDPLAGLRNA